ncbi:hypothetical protein ACQEVX_23130 [Streptomyces syringium]|uniref:hypothetical protein n=1 Tax=Streptomyces syringium TaxID=76729 RepID=UPI003D8D15BF
MRIPFISDALYHRKLRRQLINTAHHDYFRMLAENSALGDEVEQLREERLMLLREGRIRAFEAQDITVAAMNFAAALTESDRAYTAAVHLSCVEVDRLATLLVAVGRSDVALRWLETHSLGDNDEDDLHKNADPVDLEMYLLGLAA